MEMHDENISLSLTLFLHHQLPKICFAYEAYFSLTFNKYFDFKLASLQKGLNEWNRWCVVTTDNYFSLMDGELIWGLEAGLGMHIIFLPTYDWVMC